MRNLLEVLEIALLTFIALAMLLFVLGYLIFTLPGWMAAHPQYAADWLWYIIWGIMGGIVIFMAALWWWWGRVLKDRETASQVLKSLQEEDPGTDIPD